MSQLQDCVFVGEVTWGATGERIRVQERSVTTYTFRRY